MNCIACQSSNLVEENITSRIMKKTDSEVLDIPINKFLCLDCGCIFEMMNEKNLAVYKEELPHFVK
jgi:predicted nucleic-acid-binding Zn-ribbon protein